jgi:diguanylate cyclase (GGDEF)-like protein
VLLRNYRKDGTVFWNEMTIVPLLDAEGRVTHFAGHHRDAGERLRIDSKSTKDSVSGAHQPTATAVRDDRLTGLFTLPYLEELLKRDWALAQRESRSIAVFAIDIDALDLYNTTFGRAAGDSAIRRVAHVISGCLRRSSDVTARIDGGSLMAFAPGLSLDQAMNIGHTMSERVRQLRIHHPRSTVLRYMSVSVGVSASVPAQDAHPSALLEKSQQQLKFAKNAGRNHAA